MNKTKCLLLAVAVAAMAFTVSCMSDLESAEEILAKLSSSSEGNSQSYGYCLLSENEMCLEGPFTLSYCNSIGGLPSNNCPYGVVVPGSSGSGGLSSSGGGGGNPQSWGYCLLSEYEICLEGPYTLNDCNSIGGLPSNNCHYGVVVPGSSGSGGLSSSSGEAGNELSSPSVVPSSPSVEPSSGSVVPSSPSVEPSSGSVVPGSSGGGVPSSSSVGGGVVGSGGPVSYYGKLKASGNRLVGSKTGVAVQVRGVSLFWSNTGWGGDRFFNKTAIDAMVDDWKAEIIRVPIGYAEDDGYKTDPSNLTRVKTAINAAIAKDVYVIIDWHSHNAHNETSAATAFFTEMAQTYGRNDHVIFEIYNEPLDISWTTIKTYASTVISAIRQYSDNLILVGTPNWDQDIDVAASSPISDNNVAYVFHFYANTHALSSFQSKLNTTLNANLPVFVSEYGTVSADGDGTHNASASNAWHTFMDANKISSCAWSVNDKAEASAFFGTGTSFDMSSWTNTSKMTASGQYIYNKLKSYANSGGGSSSGSGGGDVLYCDFGPFDSYGGGCYIISSTSECDLDYGTVRTYCPRKQYCDFGPVDEYGGGCFEIDDANECDLEWGTLTNRDCR